MAWIKSHEELATHWKVVRLAEIFRKEVVTVLGHLHLLWYFTLRNAWSDGDLSHYEWGFICHQIHWKDDPLLLLKSLQEVKLLDGMKIHDWKEFSGDFIRKRKANIKPKRRGRNNSGNIPEDGRRNSHLDKSRVDKSRVEEKKNIAPTGANPKITKKNEEKEPTPFWKEMLKHIEEAYFKKKKERFYWRPKYFKDLKGLSKVYQPWGVMALWDCHLTSKVDFVRNAGYSMESFFVTISSLVDDSFFKMLRGKYEKELNGETPKEMKKVLETAVKSKEDKKTDYWG